MFLDEFFLYLYLSHQKSNRLRRNLSIVYNVKLNWTETNGVFYVKFLVLENRRPREC